MKELILSTFFFVICLTGCNTILVTHTQGQASDVVDSTPTTEAKVDANIAPNVSVIPKSI